MPFVPPPPGAGGRGGWKGRDWWGRRGEAAPAVGRGEWSAGISADGASIGYLRTGRGPAVVVLHGSNESARSNTQLALALASG